MNSTDDLVSDPRDPVKNSARNDADEPILSLDAPSVKNTHLNVEGLIAPSEESLYSNQEESEASALVEREHSFATKDPLKKRARESAGGHAKLFEVPSTDHVPVEPAENVCSDVDERFDRFRSIIHGATPAMFAERDHTTVAGSCEALGQLMEHDISRPGTFLSQVYLTCCPSNAGASRFCFLAFQYLLETPWAEKYTVELFGLPAVVLPSIYEPEGLHFLQLMDKTYLAPFKPRSAGVHCIYRKLALSVQRQPAPAPLLQQAREKVFMYFPPDNNSDAAVRLLIRGLWDSAHFSVSPDWLTTASLRLQDNREQPSSQSSGILLHQASFELSDQQLGRQLRLLLSSDDMGAPLELSRIIMRCMHDDLMIPSSLDYLELVPSSVLRTWIAAMSVTATEARTVPQLGQKSLAYVHMWFKLLYRLDMRRGPSTEHQASLYQFALKTFICAHFEYRYPHSRLIVGLLYGLLGHDSFAGNLSVQLFDWIESYVLFLVPQDHKPASLNVMLVKLMSDLASKSLPNHGVLELIIPYMSEYKSFHSVTKILERLSKSGTKISNTKYLDTYVDQVREEVSKRHGLSGHGNDVFSFRRFLDANRALDVMMVESQSCIIECGSRRFFNHILARANNAHIVPLAYRKLTPDIPKEVQGDLIHQFAHQYAMDRTRSCQQNWRALHYLYLYLRNHQLPIQPLFTRSIVSVGITRPLQESKFVAQKRAVWVCRLVAKAEGVEAARRVEQYFWAGRGNLILQAKRDLVELEEYDEVHVGTMGRLNLLSRNPSTRSDQEDDTREYGV